MKIVRCNSQWSTTRRTRETSVLVQPLRKGMIGFNPPEKAIGTVPHLAPEEIGKAPPNTDRADLSARRCCPRFGPTQMFSFSHYRSRARKQLSVARTNRPRRPPVSSSVTGVRSARHFRTRSPRRPWHMRWAMRWRLLLFCTAAGGHHRSFFLWRSPLGTSVVV
jgi:hypothetical protein